MLYAVQYTCLKQAVKALQSYRLRLLGDSLTCLCHLYVLRVLCADEQLWETGSFDVQGRCFAMIQDNGMFVVMSGDDPRAPGNVLWSSNRGVGAVKPSVTRDIVVCRAGYELP